MFTFPGKYAFFGAVLGLGASLAAPAAASDFQSPRTLSLGGAGHAGPLLNDPLYLNPAFVSFNQTYALGYSFMKFSDNEWHGRNYNISIQDGRTELFQAGLGYTVREDGSLVHLVASKRVLPILSTGLAAKMFFGKDRKTTRDLMVALGGVATPFIQVALVADNLVESVEAKRHGFYREVILGSKFNIMGIVLAYVDPHFTPSLNGAMKFGHEAGLEFPLMADLFLRMGTFRNSNIFYQNGKRGNGWGAGLGWVAPRLSVDYAYSRMNDTRSGLHRAVAHNLGATIFF